MNKFSGENTRVLLKKFNGITLIALIITVVIILILAGIAISVLTSDGGLFEKTTMSAKEYKKQSIIEIIKSAEFQLEIDAQLDKSIEKNITNLLSKLAEMSDINSTNYNITNNNLDEATIIDKNTGIVVDIKILPSGRVDVGTSIVGDISDVVKPNITYLLDPTYNNYAKEVKIILNVEEITAGIVKIKFPDNTEKIYDKQKNIQETYIVNKNDLYKFTAVGANGRKVNCYVNVMNVRTNPILNEEANVGNYVKYTVNNKEIVCKVIDKGSTMKLVTDGILEKKKLTSMDGYNNAEKYLDEITLKYLNSDLFTSIRCVRETDVTMLSNCNSLNIGDRYWLANKHYHKGSGNDCSDYCGYSPQTYYNVRYVTETGTVDGRRLYCCSRDEKIVNSDTWRNGNNLGVRAIIEVKNDVEILDGEGTSAMPWII